MLYRKKVGDYLLPRKEAKMRLQRKIRGLALIHAPPEKDD
jgi:hypothetical protein